MTKTPADDTPDYALMVRNGGLPALPQMVADETNRQYLVRMMEMLPDPQEDVADKIIGQILSAESPMEENMLWDATSSKNAVGKEFIFKSCHLLPSDFEDSQLPYFLVCNVVDLDTGEDTVLTTGSANIVTSLVKAQVLGRLPWQARITGPKRIPKSGRIPLRLTWIAKVATPADEG